MSAIALRRCWPIEASVRARPRPWRGAWRRSRAPPRPVSMSRVRKLGRIVLSEAPLETLNAEEMREALGEAVRDEGLAILDWSESARQARARVALMRSLEGETWPDWSDEALLVDLHWLPLDGV